MNHHNEGDIGGTPPTKGEIVTRNSISFMGGRKNNDEGLFEGLEDHYICSFVELREQ